MDDKIFRAYDIRGVYPVDITEDVAYKIGLGFGSYIQEFMHETACVVSNDNRLSGPSLKKSLIKGLLETGIKVYDYGMTTTPMHYFARYKEGVCGVMITASHNPKDDNGFKFSFDRFANARGEMITNFRDYISAGFFIKGNGVLEEKNIIDDYINYLVNNLRMGDRKIKIVLDPANGVPVIVARKLMSKFNIDLTIINEESDGTFPNHHPDPSVEENLEELKAKVLEVDADLGIGFDGDGDRIGIIDENGKLVSIETYSVLMVRDMFDAIEKKEFLYDAKSSNNFKDEIEKLGGKAVICRTGSSYTQEKVIKENLAYGFQYVGHVSINDRIYDVESAMYATLRLVEILSKTDKSLSELASTVPQYINTPEIKVAVSDDKKFGVIDSVEEYCKNKGYEYVDIDGIKIQFSDGWAYVRASNTGPNLTLKFEANTKERLEEIKNEFTNLINSL